MSKYLNIAIILAAGNSERSYKDKLFTEIVPGVPVIAHTLKIFQLCNLVDTIILVGNSKNNTGSQWGKHIFNS